MTVRSRSLLPHTVAVALLASLALSGCSGDKPAPNKPPSTKADMGDNTHDGAVPIAVVTSWMKDVDSGNGEVACAYSSPTFQEFITAAAVANGGVKRNVQCPDAVVALSGTAALPSSASAFDVVSAVDDSTILTLTQADESAYEVAFVKTKDQWLIESLTPTE